MQFKGVNNKERQQYPRSEVSLKRMRISAVCHPCGVGLAVRGVLSASVAESSRHLALPPSLPLFLSTVFQCDGCLFLSLVRGGSWLGCSVVPAMGALFSLGAGCQKWKPLDIPGTQPPLSDVENSKKSIKIKKLEVKEKNKYEVEISSINSKSRILKVEKTNK